MANTRNQLEQPASGQTTPPSTMEARVFTMPERYRHGAEAVMHQPESQKKAPAPVEVKTPVVPVPPKAPPKQPPKPTKRKQSSSKKKILIVGGIVLLLLGGGAIYVLQTMEEPAQPQSSTPVTSRPAPTTPVVETPDEPEEPDTPEEPEEPEVFEPTIIPGVDTDSDGLTDTEENLVYNTDPRLPDTDADGFLDGNEVFHRYNPGGTAPGTLLESGLVKRLEADTGNVLFVMLYPAGWNIEENEDSLTLDAETGEGFNLRYRAKPRSEALELWVEENLSLTRPLSGTTKNGLDWVQSEDQLTVYVDLGQSVLVIEYDTGIKARVDYLQTFQMMLNSIEIKDVRVGASESSIPPAQADTEEPGEAVEEPGEASASPEEAAEDL